MPGCESLAKVRGLCKPHYNAERESHMPPCLAEGCTNPQVSKGLCRSHYMSKWRNPTGMPRSRYVAPRPYGPPVPAELKRKMDNEARSFRRRPGEARFIKYGLSRDAYEAMVAERDGLCDICGQPPAEGKELDVDHDHAVKRTGPGIGRGRAGLRHSEPLPSSSSIAAGCSATPATSSSASTATAFPSCGASSSIMLTCRPRA